MHFKLISNYKFQISNSQKGIATLEILIAMTLIVFSISATLPLVFSGQSTSVDSQTNQEALYKAQALLEDGRATGFNSVNAITATLDGIYTKNRTVVPDINNSDIKTVTSNVLWNNGKQQYVSLSTILTDPFSAAGICNPTVSLGWDHPQAYAFDSAIDLAQQATGNSSNGLGIADVKILRHKMYIAAEYTANDSNDFYVFGLTSNPMQTPSYLGRTNTVGRSNHYALHSVAVGVSGNRLYAYVANAINFNFTTCVDANLCPQFQIIDVTPDPVTGAVNPTIVPTGNLKMPVTGPNTCNGSNNCLGGQGTGKVIYYNQGYVYLGLIKPASGPEFYIIDVGGGGGAASPTNPILKGSYTVGNTINDIVVKDNYAYLATDDNSGGINHGNILVLDITNKNANPLPVASYYNAASIAYGRSVSVSGSNIYLGRTYINSTSANYYSFNGSPMSAPLSVSSSKVTGANDNIDGLAVRSNLVFLMINNSASLSNSRFQVLDMSNGNNPYGSISLQSIVAQLQGNGNNFSGSSTLNCTGNYFYISIQTNGHNKDILAVIGPNT